MVQIKPAADAVRYVKDMGKLNNQRIVLEVAVESLAVANVVSKE